MGLNSVTTNRDKLDKLVIRCCWKCRSTHRQMKVCRDDSVHQKKVDCYVCVSCEKTVGLLPPRDLNKSRRTHADVQSEIASIKRRMVGL